MNELKAQRLGDRAKLEGRRRQMIQMYLAGATQAMIAKQLGLSLRHVESEFGRYRAELLAAVSPERRQVVIANELADFQARRDLLWQRAHDSKLKEATRQDCLQQLREEQKEHWKRLQTLGVVPRDLPPIMAMGDVEINQTTTETKTIIVQWAGGESPKPVMVPDPERQGTAAPVQVTAAPVPEMAKSKRRRQEGNQRQE